MEPSARRHRGSSPLLPDGGESQQETERAGNGCPDRLLTDAIDTIQDLFFVFTFDGEMLTWNDRLPETTGYTDAEVAEMQPLNFVAPEQRVKIAGVIQSVVDEGEAQTEAHLLTKGGDRIPYEFWGSLLTDEAGDPVALCGTGRDITDRKRRRADLRAQAERVSTLNHINAVIRDVNDALVRATTRREIESTVCELLADARPYSFAWVGHLTVTGDRVEPRAAAGEAVGYLDDRPESSSDGTTAADAIRTGEVQVIQSIADDPDSAPWREAALEHGFESAAAIPLRYRETDYGVLCLYAPRPQAFAETEREVLTELGQTIGYAIAASEQRRALVSDTIVEVDLGFEPRGPYFLELAVESGASLELEGSIANPEGGVDEFFAVDADPDDVATVARAIGGRCTVVSRFETGGVVRVHPDRPSIAALVAHYGGVLRTATADGESGRASIELPAGADVRTVVETVADAYDGTELLAQRERERTSTRGQEFRDSFDEALTDRQQEVLETAYYAGFFEWPRDSSAEEVAELVGVTPPTFHEHLRRAERKLLGAYFESGPLTD
jgi:PAS domain S-box-containing protein